MNIATTEYNFKYKALEIYLSGCDGICGPECHNPELWDFSVGKDWIDCISTIENKLRGPESAIINNVWILGGEPTLHPHLIALLNWLNAVTTAKIWLFTREEAVTDLIIEKVDYVKYGKYIPELAGDNIQMGISLATTNQRIERGKRNESPN